MLKGFIVLMLIVTMLNLVQPYGLNTPLPTLNAPWFDIFMNFVLDLPRTKRGRKHFLSIDEFFESFHTLVIKMMMLPMVLTYSLTLCLKCMLFITQLLVMGIQVFSPLARVMD